MQQTNGTDVKNNKSGFATLVAVIIIGAVSLVMAKNATILDLGEINAAFAYDRGEEALAIAEGCVEETIRRFTLDPDYSANGFNLSLGSGNCVIDTVANGIVREITVVGRTDNFYRTVNAAISLTDEGMVLESWD
ncbi:hypothetical protein A2303_01765 [Candidatus Falkowbacteria bacterium RIFOXYB2_FULL_47_14]|uniref:Type 4 fimbrial biogenesis protein PilX N-terminal domain-containing protein n=1 Tax=Candidatus Falkowbacteria bacterium RIFOXYA2_FULL_47_19 TaxID=1797994 RepID=A0A1F5SJJ0_9BACT|nr:MAG: hypothetical protein A2227_06170 [Candidatus Falkowbacteria bacterium RIFOXYA2_FULL_47_19]OGF37099.1 MAG: hypothetical protein A2468_05360 [Candidatus Falkowbacteria bacterium RIFOXYC2_FULL_46_15]OGF43241.1 MAG: hypothetical protein A2303_01765 [Candidatus Falkowbacteria bacterium RIFOXYB2_FULL_47_14]